MRRVIALLFALLCLFVAAGGAANAESQQVTGTGDITSMTANNGIKALTAKVLGIEAPCGGAAFLWVSVENRTGKLLYRAEGVCAAGVEWHTDLYYTATGDPNDETLVDCPNFAFTRHNSTNSYQVKMPRGCLDNAPNKVIVVAEGLNYGSMGGTAGPTRVLARG